MSARPLASIALVVALAAAACGDDDDDGERSANDVYFGALETRPAAGGEPGLEVVRVEPNSPASSSGLQRGDVITTVDGEATVEAGELSSLLAELSETRDAGEKVEIAARRGSRPRIFTVRLAANVYVGAQLLAPPKGEAGARVGGVPGGTPADGAGLRRDDLITAVDGRPISGSNQFIQELAGYAPGDEIELTLSRASEELTVSLTLEPRG
jgi:S1-C subfamily serine protease